MPLTPEIIGELTNDFATNGQINYGPKPEKVEFVDAFDELAHHSFASFRDWVRSTGLDCATPKVKDEIGKEYIRTGFVAIGHIIGLSLPAYQEHCAKKEIVEDPNELVDILRKPESFANTAVFLANMGNFENRHWEMCLGIWPDRYRYALHGEIWDCTSLVVRPTEPSSNELVLDINPEVRQFTIEDPEYFVSRSKDSTGRRCLAIPHGSLRKMWDLQIDKAEKQRLFDAVTYEVY